MKFNKSDLRTGHIVKFRDRENAILIGDTFFSSMHLDGGFNNGHLDQYNEHLKDIKYGYETDIMEVYYIKSTEHDLGLTDLINNLPEEHTELIWKRELDIDWTKVPKWTKVLVRNFDDYIWRKRYFFGVDNKGYKATYFDEFTIESERDYYYWDEIKLFDKNDIKEEWYK